MTTLGEALVAQLEARDVTCVFGIPGVHTVEMYRGLAQSNIRHVTPRHEQGAGFMADGYARASGKPGVALVITGPGLANTLTAMGQARADSVPMLVLSGVNSLGSLGKGLGHLHELPDQRAMARTVALLSERVEQPQDLSPALDAAFVPFHQGRPGPTHIEIPLDVAGAEAMTPALVKTPTPPTLSLEALKQAVALLNQSKRPVIIAGGGARFYGAEICKLAEYLDAPVVQTVNARGIMFDHPLSVPASPSLTAVRELISGADVVLALGTELGQTDFDMYATGEMPVMARLIRVDRDAEQLARHAAEVSIHGDAGLVATAITAALGVRHNDGKGGERAAHVRTTAFTEIGPDMRALCAVLDKMRDTLPGSLMVGDSTYPIYAGNLYYDHDRAGGWFNAATGFGALGYGIPAAIGAAIAQPDAPVICIAGDGGAQFSLPEMMVAVDENLPIRFVIWNNFGYQEIATSMQAANVEVVGCDPTPPDFEYVAKSCGMPFSRVDPDPEAIAVALAATADVAGPTFIEIRAPNVAHKAE